MTNLLSLENRIGMPSRLGWDPSRVIDQRVISDVPVRVRHHQDRVFIAATPDVEALSPVGGATVFMSLNR